MCRGDAQQLLDCQTTPCRSSLANSTLEAANISGLSWQNLADTGLPLVGQIVLHSVGDFRQFPPLVQHVLEGNQQLLICWPSPGDGGENAALLVLVRA
jgi:hypothetical protein